MSLALPSRRDEAWRWADLSALPELAAAQPTRAARDVRGLRLGDGPFLVFVDGVLDAAQSAPGPLRLGPVGAATEHPLGRHAAECPGWTLALGRDAAAPGLVEIVHVATGGANHLPSAPTPRPRSSRRSSAMAGPTA